MSAKSIAKDKRKISIIAMATIFLALIRCVSEPFRLQYYATKNLTFVDIKPFLVGALVTSLSLLIMSVLSIFGKYKSIVATSLLTINVLLIIKRMYIIT